MPERRFDRAYYDRFYRDPSTRVASGDDTLRLARFVLAYLDFLELDVQRVLDLGCGLGPWRDALAELRPDAEYTGVEVSGYLCREYGWEQGSVVDYEAEQPFDLVICQGVLQYVDDARGAVENLTRLCSGALFLEVLTRRDWEENCDRRRTDGNVHLRTAAYYRRLLRDEFANAGGGVFLSRRTGISLFELESLD